MPRVVREGRGLPSEQPRSPEASGALRVARIQGRFDKRPKINQLRLEFKEGCRGVPRYPPVTPLPSRDMIFIYSARLFTLQLHHNMLFTNNIHRNNHARALSSSIGMSRLEIMA